ncbi:MAG: hypothetical protein H7Z37_00665 [Pyrinomonadaceae bacterium]|nr:hypothetical protein [Pyrinomonadaceae bacterium]
MASVLAILVFIALACNASTANLSSFKASKVKDGEETSSFKTGDTIYGKAVVSNNPGKVKVKLYLTADDAKGLTKGETLKGSEVSIDLAENVNIAAYSLPVSEGLPAGTYKLNADMINEAGEKKDSKTANITVSE